MLRNRGIYTFLVARVRIPCRSSCVLPWRLLHVHWNTCASQILRVSSVGLALHRPFRITWSRDCRVLSGSCRCHPQGAFNAFEKAGQQLGEFLARHVSGDWGEVDANDIKENELSLRQGFRLVIAYRTSAADEL